MSTLTRRDVIRGAAAFGISPLLSKARILLPAEGFSFAFFSDTHVGLKANIKENREMFAEMKGLPIDFAINGGDVTDYGWTGEYNNYREILSTVSFPVHHIAGNHDVRWSPLGPKAYKAGTGSPMYSSFDHKGCHFALLDSTVPLSHWGHFESEMLRWLEADLKKVGRDTPVFLFTHHWVGRDGVMVDNEADLLPIIEPYNVKIVFNGHGHSDLLWTWEGLANTMNKGLYQLSYQRVDVDPAKGQVRLSRRTKEKPEQVELLQVPLKAGRDKRNVWAIPAAFSAGIVLAPGVPTARQFRWDDGKWQDIPASGIPSESLKGGTHRLSLRADDKTFFNAGEARVHATSGVLKPRWERKLSGGVMSHLRLSREVLYVSAMDGSLAALRANDGQPLWTAKTAGYCHSSPCIHEDLVIVGSADGNVYAFDRQTGDRVWRFATAGPVYASGAVAKGILGIASGDGSVYGLDLVTGAKRWQYDLPKSNTAFIQSPAATDGERFYMGAWDSHLYALDAATGSLAWRAGCCNDRSFAYSPAIGNPIVGEGRVYVPANGNVLFAFETVTGAPVWQTSSPGDKIGYSSPSLAGDRIVIGCLGDKGEARCIASADGKILWTTPTGSVIYDSGPCVAEDVAIFGSVSGLLTAVKMADGEVVGQYRMPTGHLLATPVADRKRVYAASYSDVVMSFDLV